MWVTLHYWKKWKQIVYVQTRTICKPYQIFYFDRFLQPSVWPCMSFVYAWRPTEKNRNKFKAKLLCITYYITEKILIYIVPKRMQSNFFLWNLFHLNECIVHAYITGWSMRAVGLSLLYDFMCCMTDKQYITFPIFLATSKISDSGNTR